MTKCAGALLGLLALSSACLGSRDAPPGLGPPVVRGHGEVRLAAAGEVVPLILPSDREIGLCLEVAASRDTSSWRTTVSFAGRPSPSGAVAAAARSGQTVCFDAAPPAALPPGPLEICGRLVDEFDGTEHQVPCRPAFYLGDDAVYREIAARRGEVVRQAYRFDDIGQLLEHLDATARDAQDEGFLLSGVRAALISVHFLTLEGTPAALGEARRRLAGLPAWLDQPAACHQAALAAYQRALLDLDSQRRLEAAWSHLADADRLFQRIADPKRFTVTMEQASILHQIGATAEAIRRLRDALAECVPGRCPADLLAAGQSNLAWLILLNPEASDEELDEAEAYLRRGLARLASGEDPLELANRRVDLAYLAVRRGEDPGELLAAARDALAAPQLGTERAQDLRDWAALVEGAAALAGGDGPRALELCSALADRDDSRLAAWALSCSARAHRLAGDPEAAERDIGGALVHAYAAASGIGRPWTLDPGQRADDFARAARLAIERGDPARAWRLLLELDQLSSGEAERRRCRERASPGDRSRWEAIDKETARILATLRSLEVPASARRRAEQQQLLRELKTRIQELWHAWPGCASRPSAGDQGLEYRAFALEDEIVLLHRRAEGEVTVEKRTPFARRGLRRIHDRVVAAVERQDLDDDAWAELLRPMSVALLPLDAPAAGDLVVPAHVDLAVYALHGMLQAIPLAALPLPGDHHGDVRWFGQAYAVAVQPAGARALAPPGPGSGPPLFVVDPRANLPASPQLLATYRELFPTARVLAGGAATHAAFRRESARASWLHVDAHGLYDPAFPRLSALQLADRPIHWVELADTPMSLHFANLSGCQTGRWPITADSGSYGIAGLVARLGVGWAVASRSDLADRVAMDFNRSFYAAIAAGDPVPVAYHRALQAVAQRHLASTWCGLVLLRAAGAEAAALR
jgi:hypothetical protein